VIAVCLPSRGLIFSKTVESVIKGMQELNKLGMATIYCTSHDMNIPQAHNYCVETALQNKAVKKIFFIEEDNYLFPEAFVALATSDYDIATVQYNDKNGSPFGIIHYNEAGEVLWGGLGSTVFKREVFEKLGAPYFRIDTLYKNTKKHLKDGKLVTEYQVLEPQDVWDEEENKFKKKKNEYKYGGLDIDIYTRARHNGFSIGVIGDHKGHHFELVSLGEKQNNKGIHEIRQV